MSRIDFSLSQFSIVLSLLSYGQTLLAKRRDLESKSHLYKNHTSSSWQRDYSSATDLTSNKQPLRSPGFYLWYKPGCYPGI